MERLYKKLLPSSRETLYGRIIDSTYWRWRRENRRCAKCGIKWTYKNKVNHGTAFDKDKKLYHEACLPKL